MVFVGHTGNTSLRGVVPCPPMQVASVHLGLVSMQAPLISRITRSAKLPFFQAVIVIVDFTRIQDYEEQREYARDELNI